MSRWVPALRLTGVGFFIGVCILIGTFTGLWLDSKLDTRPIFILLGLFCGLGMAFFGVYRMIVPIMGNRTDKGND